MKEEGKHSTSLARRVTVFVKTGDAAEEIKLNLAASMLLDGGDFLANLRRQSPTRVNHRLCAMLAPSHRGEPVALVLVELLEKLLAVAADLGRTAGLYEDGNALVVVGSALPHSLEEAQMLLVTPVAALRTLPHRGYLRGKGWCRGAREPWRGGGGLRGRNCVACCRSGANRPKSRGVGAFDDARWAGGSLNLRAVEEIADPDRVRVPASRRCFIRL